MVTNKQKEIIELLNRMELFIRKQGYLPIEAAHEFLMMGSSISERFKEMNESRDSWKEKAEYWRNKYLELQTK